MAAKPGHLLELVWDLLEDILCLQGVSLTAPSSHQPHGLHSWKFYLLCLSVPIQVKHGVGSHGFARCRGHSLAQQTSSSVSAVPPCLPFRLCVFARCKEAAELCSCCVPKHGEGTAGAGSMEVSCPVLSHPGAVPPAHHSVPGPVFQGTTAVLLGTAVCLLLAVVVVDGDSRGEKGENVCSDVLWSVAGLWYPARSGASNSFLHAALSGVLMIWGALTTRILQGTSPLSHLWDSHR